MEVLALGFSWFMTLVAFILGIPWPGESLVVCIGSWRHAKLAELIYGSTQHFQYAMRLVFIGIHN